MTMLRWRPMDGRGEAQPPSATKLTYDDFLSFPDDGRRHELIDGEHFVTPSPVTVHQRLVRRLLVALDACLNSSGAGEVFHAPFDVVLSKHDVVEPDLLVILDDQTEILTEKHVRGAPAIVIEILSPGTRRRDETLKRRLYERAGVREYWMVDPKASTVVVLGRGVGDQRTTDRSVLQTVSEFSEASDDALTSALLPGLSLSLHDLFAEDGR